MVAKIIERLGKVFSKNFREKLERQKTLDDLIDTLIKKEQKIQHKLAFANDDKQKDLTIQLEVLQAQLEKAKKLRDTDSHAD